MEIDISKKTKNVVRPEVRAAYYECVRRKFIKWQKSHPELEVASATMPTIRMMIVAMATDYDKV